MRALDRKLLRDLRRLWAQALAIALVIAGGVAIGAVAGTWLGMTVTALFAEFFRFPFLVFIHSPDV